MNLNLYLAQVNNINDPDKKGRIRVKIIPHLQEVADTDLPWAVPFSSSLSSSQMENDLPLVNTMIRVLVDNKWKRFYYLPNAYFYELFNFDNVSDKLPNDVSNKEYQYLSFKLYKDGGLEFHNNNSGDHGFIHKSGSYSIFDNDGNIKVDTKTSDMSIKCNGNTIESSSTSLIINGNLEILQ